MQSDHRGFVLAGVLVVSLIGTTVPATGQFYTFTSGPSGDGFVWDGDFPPSGLNDLQEFDSFTTPDGIDFYNDVGNTIFFDSSYQVVGNGSLIDGDALWANPTDLGGSYVGIDLNQLGNVQELSFDFAWSEAGVPAATDFITINAFDSDGRSSFFGQTLSGTFTGFGGGTGYEDTVFLSTGFLVDDDFNVDGGAFIDIDYVEIYLFDITGNGNNSEFAIDNFSVDGSGGGGPDEVFPSFNQGSINASNVTSSSNSLRGTGTFTRGVEVTNGGSGSTTFSVQVEPGGDMTAGPSTVSGANIAAGQSLFNPDVVSLDRSLPTGSYTQDLRIINDGDPTDPDNITTVRSNLFESEQLSGNFANVDVNNFEDVTLANAAAPAGGFRAAVKTTGATTTGPFNVDAWADGTRLLDGDSIQANVTFDRFGQLSGAYNGTHIVSLEQAAFVVNQFTDIEVFLANKESVPNQVWNLSYTHVNATTDSGSFSPGGSFNKRIGVNTFDVAATLIDGTSSKNQQIGLQFMSNPGPGNSADLIGGPVDLAFSSTVDDTFVLQLTYEPVAIPVGATENDLLLLWYDDVLDEWVNAVDGNAGGTPTFFSGSYADFLNGGALSAGDLGTYGLDTANNHVWAVLNHASLFAVGVLSSGVIAGDYNNDGSVDQGDLDLVLLNWGDDASATGVPAGWVNFQPAGLIGQTELDGVLLNWGNTAETGASSVPEPAAAGLLLGLAAMFRRSTCRRKRHA